MKLTDEQIEVIAKECNFDMTGRLLRFARLLLAAEALPDVALCPACFVEVEKRAEPVKPIGFIDPNTIEFLKNGHLTFTTLRRDAGDNATAPLYAAPVAEGEA